jgi:hypothetical protein
MGIQGPALRGEAIPERPGDIIISRVEQRIMFTDMMVSLHIRTIAMLPQVDKERYCNACYRLSYKVVQGIHYWMMNGF